MSETDADGVKLPEGWQYVTEGTEHPYYWHVESGDVQWERPDANSAPGAEGT